jgi:hypothetical protein
MPQSNLERIMEEARNRQKQGKTADPTVLERQTSGGDRTPRSPDAPKGWAQVNPKNYPDALPGETWGAYNARKFGRAGDPAVMAARQLEVDREEAERRRRNRIEARNPTLFSGPLGDTSSPQLARPSLMGY